MLVESDASIPMLPLIASDTRSRKSSKERGNPASMMTSLAPNYLVQQLEQLSLSPETSRNQEEEVVFKGRTESPRSWLDPAAETGNERQELTNPPRLERNVQVLNACAPCFTPQRPESSRETTVSPKDGVPVQPSSSGDGDELRLPPRSSRQKRHTSLAHPRVRNQFDSPPPQPSASYIKLADETPVKLSEARPLLVVLDLNGTLLHRRRARHDANFTLRSRAQWFLDYLFCNHKVMVWSSATPRSVESICNRIFTEEQRKKLLGVWTRVNFNLSKERYKEKVQVYKQLSKIWTDPKIRDAHPIQDECWTQENTILVDDSREKAASEPYNHIEVDEFVDLAWQKEQSTLEQVKEYLEELKWQKNVSAYIRQEPFVYERPKMNGLRGGRPTPTGVIT